MKANILFYCLFLVSLWVTVLVKNKIERKLEDNRSLAKLALFNTYCNNYQHRALRNYVRKGNWDGYPLFSPVCDIQDALEVENALKYRNWKPENTKHIHHSYDGYFTGKGHDGANVNKMHKEHLKKIRKRVDKLLEKL